MGVLGRLWRGDLPLSEAFWTWALIVGLAVNLTTTFGSLILFVHGRTMEALFVGYAFSVPYNIVAAVGVWRSAARYEGPRWLADAARWATAAGMVAASLT